MIRYLCFVISIVGMAGCEPEPDQQGVRGLSMMDTDMGEVDRGPDPDDAGPQSDAAPVDDESQFIVLNDTTMGLGLGAEFGSDLDAVMFECPDGRRGFGVHAEGVQIGAAAELAVEAATGAPDGPCDPLRDCAAHVSAGGWLAVQLQSGDLTGCTVRMYELADGGDDRFEAWLCATPTLNGSCDGPLFTGSDGQVAEGIVR